jgi:hypothetical protein
MDHGYRSFALFHAGITPQDPILDGEEQVHYSIICGYNIGDCPEWVGHGISFGGHIITQEHRDIVEKLSREYHQRLEAYQKEWWEEEEEEEEEIAREREHGPRNKGMGLSYVRTQDNPSPASQGGEAIGPAQSASQQEGLRIWPSNFGVLTPLPSGNGEEYQRAAKPLFKEEVEERAASPLLDMSRSEKEENVDTALLAIAEEEEPLFPAPKFNGDDREEKEKKRKRIAAAAGASVLLPDDCFSKGYVDRHGKTRKPGSENTESGADGEGLEDVTEQVPVSLHVPEVMQDVGGGGATLEYQDVGGGGATLEHHALDQTIWAHLEFEDGHIVPLKNSVSTSFYIGRETSPPEHYHRFYHKDDDLCRRVSAKHCHILRLDTGFFSSCISRLTRVLS